jgi:hypothetical protein
MNASKTAEMTTGSVVSRHGTRILVAEMTGTIATFADVLLLGGDMKRPAFIRPTFDALARTLPHNRVVRFPGLDHGGSSDPGPANRGGKPGIVAPEIRSFFSQP